MRYFWYQMALKKNGLFFFLILLVTTSKGQLSNRFDNAFQYYQAGKDLFDKNQFGPSIHSFQKFISLVPSSEKIQDANILLLIARLKLNHKNAAYKLSKIAYRNPENPMSNYALTELGHYYFTKNKYRQAKKYYSKIDASVHPYPVYEKIQFNYAYSCFKTNEFVEAKNRFARIKNNQSSPYYLRSNYFYGYICYASKDFDDAISHWKKLGEKGPKTMQLQLAQLYYGRGEYDQAIDKARLANISTLEQKADLLIGKCYFQKEDYERAFIYLQKIDIPNLTNEEKVQIAYCHYLYGSAKKAKETFTEVSNSSKDLSQMANYYLAKLYLEEPNKQNAFSALAISKNISGKKEFQEVSLYNYAKLCFELNRHTEALSALELFQNKFPTSALKEESNQLLAYIFLQNKNYAKAINYIEKMSAKSKMVQEIYQKTTLNLAKQKILNKEYDQALSYLNKSRYYPENKNSLAQTYFWMGEVYFHKNEFTNSKTFYDSYLKLKSYEPKLLHKAHYNLGYTYYRLKANKIAASQFSKCVKLMEKEKLKNRLFVDALLRSADCFFLTGNYAAANGQYRKVIKNSFENKDYALFQSGIIYGLLNQFDKKIETLKKLTVEHQKSSYTDDAFFEIASTYQEQGKIKQALELYNVLISKFDYSPYLADAQLRMGLIYYNQENYDMAIGNYRRVVENFPNTAYAKQAMNFVKLIYTENGQGEQYIEFVNNLGGEISLSLQDSLLFESAWKNYRQGNCQKASIGFKKYLSQFRENGFFNIQAAYYLAECGFYNQKRAIAKENYAFVLQSQRNEFSEKSAKKLAQIYFDEQSFSLANQYFQKLEKYASHSSNLKVARIGQLRSLHSLGDTFGLKRLSFEILAMDNLENDDVSEANMRLGEYFWMVNKKDSAHFFFIKVTRLSKAEIAAKAQYYLAQYHFEKESFGKSKDAIYHLNDHFSNYTYWLAKAFVLLGDIYFEEKDYFQARATYQSILDGYEGKKELISEIQQKVQKLNQIENNKKTEEILDDQATKSIDG